MKPCSFYSPSGRIVMMVRNSTAGIIGYYKVYTNDFTGASGWSAPVKVIISTGVGRPMFIRLASGNLFFSGRNQLPQYTCYRLSSDEGDTWGDPHYYVALGVPTNKNNGYNQVIQLPNGDIATVIAQIITAFTQGKISYVTLINRGW